MTLPIAFEKQDGLDPIYIGYVQLFFASFFVNCFSLEMAVLHV